MNEQDFGNLVESIKLVGEIKRDWREPGRKIEFGPPNIKEIGRKIR